MGIFQSIVLGVIQGITEFLPISSSAHLLLVPWFFGWEDPGLAYSVLLHTGTLTAVLLYFIRDWIVLVQAGVVSLIERRIGYERDRLMFWFVVLGTIPAGLFGLLFHDLSETVFRSPLLAAVMLALVGFVMYVVDIRTPQIRTLREMKFFQAILIGIAQGFAIIPGVSRAGATITMGRWLDFKREDAAKFSFLLSMPIIFAATLFEWRDISGEMLKTIPIDVAIAGFLSALLSGVLAIYFFMFFVRQMSLAVFCWYRLLLAIVILMVSVWN